MIVSDKICVPKENINYDGFWGFTKHKLGQSSRIDWLEAKQISFFECVLAVETDDVLRATDKTHCTSKARR